SAISMQIFRLRVHPSTNKNARQSQAFFFVLPPPATFLAPLAGPHPRSLRLDSLRSLAAAAAALSHTTFPMQRVVHQAPLRGAGGGFAADGCHGKLCGGPVAAAGKNEGPR